MSEGITFIIPGKAKGKERPRHGKHGVFTPRATGNYERSIAAIYQGEGLPFLEGAIEATVKVVVGVAPSVRAKAKKKAAAMLAGDILPGKKPDVDNILKIIFDGLNGVAYKDDAQITDVYFLKRYGLEEQIEITLRELGARA